MFWKLRKIMEQELVNMTITVTKTNFGISVILKILPHLLITMIDFIQFKIIKKMIKKIILNIFYPATLA